MSVGMHTTEEIFYRIIFTSIRYDYNIPCIAIDRPPSGGGTGEVCHHARPHVHVACVHGEQ